MGFWGFGKNRFHVKSHFRRPPKPFLRPQLPLAIITYRRTTTSKRMMTLPTVTPAATWETTMTTSTIPSMNVLLLLNAMNVCKTNSNRSKMSYLVPEMRLVKPPWTVFTRKTSNRVGINTKPSEKSVKEIRNDVSINSKTCKIEKVRIIEKFEIRKSSKLRRLLFFFQMLLKKNQSSTPSCVCSTSRSILKIMSILNKKCWWSYLLRKEGFQKQK